MQQSNAISSGWTGGGSQPRPGPLSVPGGREDAPDLHGRMMLDHLVDYLRLRGEQLAQWLGPRGTADEPLGQPLCFHHVAKTGGTSLVRALRALTAAKLCRTDGGNISTGLVDDLLAEGLRSRQFIYGHPLTGAMLRLRGRARIITVLRDPRDQVISNYLWSRKSKDTPDHHAAMRLSFRDFILAHPYFAIYQTASLHVGIQDQPIARTEDLLDRLPSVLEYLGEMHAVAMPSTSDQLVQRLAAQMGAETSPKLPHRNRTRISAEHRAQHREQFEELRTHPDLAPLIAAEQAVYEKAHSLAARQPGPVTPRADPAPA